MGEVTRFKLSNHQQVNPKQVTDSNYVIGAVLCLVACFHHVKVYGVTCDQAIIRKAYNGSLTFSHQGPLN